MGDDAELYWEMEHNPYFWDEVESCSRNNSFTENKSKKKKKTIQTKSNSTRKKVNAALFIDGENISSKKAEQIQKIANKQGVLGIEKVYGCKKMSVQNLGLIRQKNWILKILDCVVIQKKIKLIIK